MSEIAANPNDIVAAPVRAPAARPAGSNMKLEGVMSNVRGFTSQPAVAKSLPAIAFLALIGIAALVWSYASQAPGRDLFRGLPDEDKAAVASALTTAGIKYNVDRSTGALTVGEDDYYQAKMLLASQGLPKGAPDGTQVLDSLPLGASRAVEGERLRGAREMDLARTIEAIDAVQSARIHLAVEQPSAFLRDRSKAAASVMLTLAPGRQLGDAQVQAIVHLVASSVPGLAPENVSVVDQNGRLLSSDSDGSSGASDRQVAIQAKIEDRYRDALVRMLTPIVGADNFTAQVHADVDFSETQATREQFPKDATVLTYEQGAFTTDGGAAGGEAGGIPGALSNQPPPAAQVAAAPGGAMTPPVPGASGETAEAAAKRTENYNRTFAVGREVSVTKEQIGSVKRLSVAVALKNPEGGKPRGKDEIAAIEALVKGAVGFDQNRGDVVAINARSFAPIETEEASWWEAGWVSLLVRNITALGLAALVIFGIARPLMKKGTAALAKRAEHSKVNVGSQIAAAIADQAQSDPTTRITLEMIEAAPGYEARAALVRNFVRQDPARAALVVRDLIRADSKEGN
ncbi:flagellar basal-body MS-ring/collar protein FliF [Allosphingosinicella indica]|uniref:Flagellar M-ring protein n=1 Tax=Allosphingosinicella indica TaxID=941907 RepID=A0A1X7GPK0_9SPHN|nr:flagellar basal-body MS-ring/collar protein FliF [Allosphingosinicella indica]SMF72609.1 flagellar M-ring protein FliF [Allosphingosinicella indica]